MAQRPNPTLELSSTDSTPLESLMATGTKLWLDSIDPEEVRKNRALGATGATSNPIIVADLIQSGQFDSILAGFLAQESDDTVVAWKMTDRLVGDAQEVFLPVWEETNRNDGYVSFELDPLLEDEACELDATAKAMRYIELGKQWSKDQPNRMIKVPATPGGLGSLEELAASGVPLNVTLIFTERQYTAARDAIWRGAQRRSSLDGFKSVYSIFVSRLDVYTQKHVPGLSDEAQGMVGIVNAKHLWRKNKEFWNGKNLPLRQEIVFASTGTKLPEDPPWKYVAAFAGSGIETNPPKTNDDVQNSGKMFEREIDILPDQSILEEIEAKVDMAKLEEVLMREGLAKFAKPQHALLDLIKAKREEGLRQKAS